MFELAVIVIAIALLPAAIYVVILVGVLAVPVLLLVVALGLLMYEPRLALVALIVGLIWFGISVHQPGGLWEQWKTRGHRHPCRWHAQGHTHYEACDEAARERPRCPWLHFWTWAGVIAGLVVRVQLPIPPEVVWPTFTLLIGGGLLPHALYRLRRRMQARPG